VTPGASSLGGLAVWAGVSAEDRTARMRALALRRWARVGKRRRRAYGRLAAVARWGPKEKP
jgi:hypothetical protein